MYIDKVIFMIILCTTSIRCSGILTRTARTINSSLFTWPQMLFSNRPNFPIIPRFSYTQVEIPEWAKDGVAGLLRLVSFVNSENGPMQIEFGPEDGPRAAAAYQRRYGHRGERLIEQLGGGFDPDIRQVSTPSIFLTPPLPPFSR